MLYEFYKSENGKRPGRVHATYLVYGMKKSEASSQVHNGTDGDVNMESSMLEAESLDEAIPTFTLTLIQEEDLKGKYVMILKLKTSAEFSQDALAEYDEVSSIHVYSIGPNPAKVTN